MDKLTVKELNDTLLGVHTDPLTMIGLVVVVSMIYMVSWGCIRLWREGGITYPDQNRVYGYFFLAVGLLGVLFGLYLVFKVGV